MFVVVDGTEATRHSHLAGLGIVFSPDGKHIAYGAREEKWFTVVDGIEGDRYDDIADRWILDLINHLKDEILPYQFDTAERDWVRKVAHEHAERDWVHTLDHTVR